MGTNKVISTKYYGTWEEHFEKHLNIEFPYEVQLWMK